MEPTPVGAMLSNGQFLTVIFAGITGILGACVPIFVERYRTRQAKEAAAKEIEVAAIKAKQEVQASARKDAIAEWQNLYAERQKEVADLKGFVLSLHEQNNSQQKQINDLKRQLVDCESRHETLERKMARMEGQVAGITNGGVK